MILIRSENGELVSPDGEYKLKTHAESQDCLDFGCCIHNPDPDTIQNRENWPFNWRSDRGIMERICPHGLGHPDLQAALFHRRLGLSYENVHGCDLIDSVPCCQRI